MYTKYDRREHPTSPDYFSLRPAIPFCLKTYTPGAFSLQESHRQLHAPEHLLAGFRLKIVSDSSDLLSDNLTIFSGDVRHHLCSETLIP